MWTKMHQPYITAGVEIPTWGIISVQEANFLSIYSLFSEKYFLQTGIPHTEEGMGC